MPLLLRQQNLVIHRIGEGFARFPAQKQKGQSEEETDRAADRPRRRDQGEQRHQNRSRQEQASALLPSKAGMKNSSPSIIKMATK